MNKELEISNKQEMQEKNVNDKFTVIEAAVIGGDLARLSPQERVTYYNKVCESLGLNPYTKPFDYINLNGKLTLYAKKDATEQLRKINGISITELQEKIIDDLYIVTATAKTKDGRVDQAKGAVNLGTLKGEQKANAIMKAETKAKRRVTLSISGMGWCDESEIDSIPGIVKEQVNIQTGEIETIKTITQIEHRHTITKQQADEVYNLLSQCEPILAKRIADFYIPKKYASFYEFPANPAHLYNDLYERLSKERNAYQESLKINEFEQAMNGE